LKTSFMTSNLKVENGLALFSGDLEKCFSEAEKLGFDGIEISIPDPKEVSLSELRSLVNKYDVKVSAIATGGAYIRDGLSFSSPEESNRNAAIRRIKDHLAFASNFQAVVVIGYMKGRIPPGCTKDEAEKQVTDCLKECNEYAAKNGVYIVLEPINRFEEDFHHSILECKDYLDKIQLSNVKMMIDSFHMNIEDADMWNNMRQAKDYIIHVHYSDSNRLAPGMGHFDFPQMTKVLKEIGYKSFISAEILPVPDSHTAARQAIKSMRSYLK